MTVEATLLKDSVAKSNDVRLCSFLLRYPKFIHAELMTHRAFSRNASSSRAIPISQMIADVKADMAKPLTFRKKKKGMQAGDPFGPRGQRFCTKLWRAAGHMACAAAWIMEKVGVHKQYANRLIEPFAHITVVVTATDWANWFSLRNHPAAQPEIRALAECMEFLWLHNEPRVLEEGQWHLPFVDDLEMLDACYEDHGCGQHKPLHDGKMMQLVRKSVACCARTSYLNHDKTASTQEKNDGLHDHLLAENPKHASPAEHQATPMADTKLMNDDGSDVVYMKGTNKKYSGNLRGWTQYRKQIPGENVDVYSKVPDYLKDRNPFEYYAPGNLVGETCRVG